MTFEDKSDVDKVTSWVYVMFAFDPVLDADVGLDPTTIGRPTKTGFYGGKAQSAWQTAAVTTSSGS